MALPKRMQAAVLAIGTLLLASCAIGYDGSGTFSSGVSDSQLASPSADDITFTPNVSGTEVTITWPVVMGAGGYEVSFYNMNDPDNPVAVGDENEVIDGCSTTRAIAEDTQYEFRIRALENTEYGNIGAESPTIAEYDTYVPSVGTIPSGTDLATYFADFSSTEVSPTEVAYELEAGGNYTMTGNVDFDRHWLTLRGDRNDPPTVTIIGDAKFTTTAGLKIKFIHFDCMLKRVRDKEHLQEGQSISYIGHGNFAVVEKTEEGRYVIVRTIPVEDDKAYKDMKEYVEALKV